MKSLLLSFMLLASSAFAEIVTLSWDKSAEADVVSYTLVYGSNPNALDKTVTVDNSSAGPGVATGVDLPPGSWTFAVYATNDEGSTSPLSDKVSIKLLKPAPGAPKNLKRIVLPIQSSNDNKNWRTIGQVDVPLKTNGDQKWKFYRLAKIKTITSTPQ